MTMKHGDDPADYTVDEVKAHYETADPAERERIIKAEADGKNRATIAALFDAVPVPADELAPAGGQAYDDRGNVRPADARWAGDANDDLTPDQLADARERQLEENRQRAAEQAKADQAKAEARAAEARGEQTGSEE